MRTVAGIAAVVLAGVVVALAGLVLPAAEARADGPKTPFVVARGHSLFGAPWRIRFGEEHGDAGGPDYAIFDYSIGDREEQEKYENGLYSAVPLPLPRAFPFSGTFGSEIDRFPESDFSGNTGPRVTRLALTMADGSEYEAKLLKAPRRLLGRHPSLGPLRFFDLFFPEAEEPTSISAYGPAGGLIKHQAIRRG